jgi:tetratricopeptide (TPR) repeat protein
MDAETQGFLDGLVESLPAACILLLTNYRPEFQHGWSTKTCYTQLRLDPLPPPSAEALLQSLLGDHPGLEPLTQRFIERTQGNPFFLEESVRTLVETQVLVGEPGAYRLARELPHIPVPATVQAVLAARIDRLPPEEKQLVQTAAVIGTEVPLALLQAIAEAPEEPLRLGLTHLQAAEFLYETRLFPEHAYTFKHALTQQVAYETLLQEQRRALHARIVEVLEGLAGERVAEQVERLAHHALRGEVWDKALAYCRQAGEKAMARSAHREAVGAFEQALEALRHLPATRDLREQAIDLRLELRNARLILGGHLERILQDLQEAETLAEALDDPRRLGRISLYLTFYFRETFQLDRALAAGQRALALAAASGEIGTHVQAHIYLCQLYLVQDDYRQAIASGRQAVAALEGEQLYERFGHNRLPAVLARAELATCLCEVGAFTEGIAVGEAGVRLAEAVNHPLSLVTAYHYVGWGFLVKGDLHQALPLLERAMCLCQEAHLPFDVPAIAFPLGLAYVRSGRVDEAVLLLERAREQAARLGRVMEGGLRNALSEAHLHAGRFEEARSLAERALEGARRRAGKAGALRLLGDIAAHHEPLQIEPAESYYRQALALAEELGTRPFQAHCHRGLGMLYVATGQREQARTALSTAIEMYQSMDMTFWLPQTEAARAQVEGR